MNGITKIWMETKANALKFDVTRKKSKTGGDPQTEELWHVDEKSVCLDRISLKGMVLAFMGGCIFVVLFFLAFV